MLLLVSKVLKVVTPYHTPMGITPREIATNLKLDENKFLQRLNEQGLHRHLHTTPAYHWDLVAYLLPLEKNQAEWL